MSLEFEASDDQLLLQSSWILRANILYSTILSFITFLSTICCVRLMRKHPIFNSSTEILLYFAIFFANVHDISHITLQFWQLYRSYFYATDRLRIFFNTEECDIVGRLLLFSIIGLIFIYFALSIDCALATFLSTRYYKLRKIPGFIIGGSVIIASGLVNFSILPMGKNNHEYMPSCQFFPSSVRDSANYFFISGILLSIFNLIVNILLLNLNKFESNRAKIVIFDCYHERNNLSRTRFDVNFQYQLYEAIMTSKAISVLLIAQISALCVYCTGSFLFRKIQSSIPVYMYHNLVIWVYAISYTTFSLPILIMLCIKDIRLKRQRSIHLITNRRENQDDRMAELRLMWS